MKTLITVLMKHDGKVGQVYLTKEEKKSLLDFIYQIKGGQISLIENKEITMEEIV